jgi:hypothetical protein
MPAPISPDRAIAMEVVAGQTGTTGTTDGDGLTAALLDYPAGICADEANGLIYFVDYANGSDSRLRSYDPATGQVATIVTGLNYAAYLAVGPVTGRIYVCEYGASHIVGFTPAGVLVYTSATSNAAGHALLPMSLTIDDDEAWANVYAVRRGTQDSSFWRVNLNDGTAVEIVDEYDPSPGPFQAARWAGDGKDYWCRTEGLGGNVWRADETGWRQETFRQFDLPQFALGIDANDDMWIARGDNSLMSVSNLTADADGERHAVNFTPADGQRFVGFAYLDGYMYGTDSCMAYGPPWVHDGSTGHLIWRWNVARRGAPRVRIRRAAQSSADIRRHPLPAVGPIIRASR